MLAIGTAFFQNAVLQVIPSLVGLIVGTVAGLVLLAAGLTFWCGIERKPVLKIVGAYFALCAALFFLFAFLRRLST